MLPFLALAVLLYLVGRDVFFGLNETAVDPDISPLAILRRSARVPDMGDKSPKTKNKQAAPETAKARRAKQKNDNKAAGQTVKPKR